ncbi:MAG: Coenzyme F420 hydrogenase/dehydrogenase, beta subunit C-terminal domain [Candidatus Methanomethylicia archaeon]
MMLAIRVKPDGVLGLKVKIWGHLFAEVVRADRCSFCGACIGVCPVKAIDVKDEKPNIVSRCIGCGFCYAQCPHTSFNVENVSSKMFPKSFKHDVLGYVKSVYAVRSMDNEVLNYAQDGGFVSTILIYALESGLIDCAVVSGVDPLEPFKPMAKLAFDRRDVLNCAGSKYTASPNLIALSKAIDEFDVENVGFVGVGCHITALRKMQYHDYGALKYGLPVRFAIGLFCSKTFYYSLLFKDFLAKRGVELNRITKTEISGGKFSVKSGGENLFSVSVKEIEPYGRKSCNYCGDFTAELADISVGNLDSPSGWNTIIVRSEFGAKLVGDCVNKGYLEMKNMNLDDLKMTIRIAGNKKKSAIEAVRGSSTS